jgi:hypothetical protein
MRSATAILILVALAAAGCGPMRGPAAQVPAALGPAEVLAAHNAWADSIQHVWSRAGLMIDMPNPQKQGERGRYDMDGHLFLRKPEDLYLHGQVMGQEVFAMGMNAERFWLWVRPKVNKVWTGRRGGQGERQFVLAAEDLMSALGMFRIALGPNDLATFDVMPAQYVLTQQRDFAGRRVPWRRIWFDRRSLRPVRVDLYDEDGRSLLMAELLKYEPVGRTDVCMTYRVRFYGSQEVDLVLRLSSVSLLRPVNPKVFEYRLPPDAKEENLDAEPREGIGNPK